MELVRRHAELSGQPLRGRARAGGPRSFLLLFCAEDLDELLSVMVLTLLVDHVDDHVERRGVLGDGTPIRSIVARRHDDLSLEVDAVADKCLVRHRGEILNRILHAHEDFRGPRPGRYAAAYQDRVRSVEAGDERQAASSDAGILQREIRRRWLELHDAWLAPTGWQDANLHAAFL